MKKLKAILLAIDILLAAAVIAAGLYCLDCWQAVESVPNPAQQAERTAQLKLEAVALDQTIQQRKTDIAALEAESETAFTNAEALYQSVKADYDAVLAERDGLQTRLDEINNADAVIARKQESIAALRTEYGTAIRALEDKILAGESEYKICYLTFDDGPSYYTDRFLTKLDELDVYATFFTIGKQMSSKDYDKRDALLRWQATSGHAIQNHTYTHAIGKGLYDSVDSFITAVKQQDETVFNATGMHTDVVRFPAGSYYCKYRKDSIAALKELGYGWIDWSANAYDSGNTAHLAPKTAVNVIWQVRQEQISVVLMHDWRLSTLDALEKIVTTLQAENYLFLPLFKESSTVGTVRPKWDG